jgi:hypothetical protein
MATPKEQSMDNTSSTTDPTGSAPTKEDNGHLTGFKLFTTMVSLTFVGFLMLLDVSVVSTVSCCP